MPKLDFIHSDSMTYGSDDIGILSCRKYCALHGVSSPVALSHLDAAGAAENYSGYS